MGDATAVVSIQDLVKEYPGGGGVLGLNLAVPEGATFGLLGPNGAGKSTTLKMLMALLRPTSGRINVLGHDVSREGEEVRRKVGYVPEHQRMYPWMTVAQIVRFVGALYPTWDQSLCSSLLKDYGLAEGKRVRELSNGMQTKLALVLALSHNPALLVLDEPTSGLDPLVREEFLEKVNTLVRESNRTVIFSSHIMSDVEEIADIVGIVDGGKVLMVAGKAELLSKTRRIRMDVESSNGALVAPEGTVYESRTNGQWHLTVFGFTEETLARIQQSNHVSDVTIEKPSLEDIFKDFVKGARLT